MNINLYINYYKDPSKQRKEELDLCVHNNLNNNHLNVILFECQKRLKYIDFFNIINNYTSDDDINIISNLDIYFDDSVKLLKDMNKNEAFALGRWDVEKNNSIVFANRSDSQDAWVFKGKINPKLNGDFNLGFLGCDNRMVYEMQKAGYKTSNPSKTIKIIHVHSSGIRNYKSEGQARKKFEVRGPHRTLAPTEWSNRK